MDNNEKQVKEEKKKYEDYSQNILLGVLSLGILVVCEMYVMINLPIEFIIGVGAVILVDLYITYKNIEKQRAVRESMLDDKLDGLIKSEKATYLLSRKRFDEIEDKVYDLMDTPELPVDDIVNAQKSIAKVTINRNKENIKAISEAIDELSKKVEELEARTSEINAGNKASSEKSIDDLQNKVISSLKETELELKNEILRTVGNIKIPAQAAAPQIIMPQSAPNVEYSRMPTPEVAPEVSTISSKMSEPESIPEQVAEEATVDTFTEEPVVPTIEEEPVVENVSEEIPEAEPETEATADDIAAAMAGIDEIVSELEAEVEDVIEEAAPEAEPEPVADEVAPEPEPEPEPVAEESAPEPEPEPVVEEVAAEPVAEEKPPMPDLSDPNHVMTPDEIAALIANTGDSAPEPEPEPELEPVEEEKPPMPDLSDPNRSLSADEIAALFANMG